MPISAAIEQPRETDGSTTRSIAVAPLIQTALQQTDLAPLRAAIRWPAGKRAPSSKSAVKRAISEVCAAEAAILRVVAPEVWAAAIASGVEVWAAVLQWVIAAVSEADREASVVPLPARAAAVALPASGVAEVPVVEVPVVVAPVAVEGGNES